MWGGAGPTAKKDKLNDNLLFSCCCARIDWSWTTVCGCYRGGWKCDQDCLEQALVEDSLFYPIGTVGLSLTCDSFAHLGQNLYNNLTYMYPTSDIWIIGHSLGEYLVFEVGDAFPHLGEKVVQWLPSWESRLVPLLLPLSHQGSDWLQGGCICHRRCVVPICLSS